jgi:hypothetical protein
VRPAEESLAAARPRRVLGLRGRFERRPRRLSFVALAAGALLCGAAVPVIAQTPATAGTIQSLQARAAALASEIDSAYAKLSVLDEAYNQAQTRVSELKTSISAENRDIAGAVFGRVVGTDTGKAWVCQMNREPLSYRFANVPGPRGEVAGRTPPAGLAADEELRKA